MFTPFTGISDFIISSWQITNNTCVHCTYLIRLVKLLRLISPSIDWLTTQEVTTYNMYVRLLRCRTVHCIIYYYCIFFFYPILPRHLKHLCSSLLSLVQLILHPNQPCFNYQLLHRIISHNIETNIVQRDFFHSVHLIIPDYIIMVTCLIIVKTHIFLLCMLSRRNLTWSLVAKIIAEIDRLLLFDFNFLTLHLPCASSRVAVVLPYTYMMRMNTCTCMSCLVRCFYTWFYLFFYQQMGVASICMYLRAHTHTNTHNTFYYTVRFSHVPPPRDSKRTCSGFFPFSPLSTVYKRRGGIYFDSGRYRWLVCGHAISFTP